MRNLRAPTNFQFNSKSLVFSKHLLCANPLGHNALLTISGASGGDRYVNKYVMKQHPEYRGGSMLRVQKSSYGGTMSEEGEGNV